MKKGGNVYNFIDLNRSYVKARWDKPEGRYELEYVQKVKFLVSILKDGGKPGIKNQRII